ncbi:hypothetical protein RFI_03268 [Reticulomyxa filosa]|uniref:Uncharacterized protein n=1 Tax=Reticulomyxa filosa TaxID=46433 RepID=X6P6W5_RETFI|nr:hypothetical protein RFI_03268 [Reticulomyxa filosa]|eukprot:ETO33829.1 hypothetical protein RFI_03268 [Reticulomyxa filosa]
MKITTKQSVVRPSSSADFETITEQDEQAVEKEEKSDAETHVETKQTEEENNLNNVSETSVALNDQQENGQPADPIVDNNSHETKSNEITDTRQLLEKELKTKQDLNKLEKEGIYKSTMQANKENLEKSQRRDTMKYELNSRPPASQLIEADNAMTLETGILKSSTQLTKEQLQKSLAKDSLKQEIEDRTEAERLEEAGILKSQMQATKEQLHKSLVKDQLKYDIEDRTEAEKLAEAGFSRAKNKREREILLTHCMYYCVKGILKTPLQLTKEQLQKSQAKDNLRQEMEDRASFDELAAAGFFFCFLLVCMMTSEKNKNKNGKGIAKTPMQATKEKLQKSQTIDQLRQEMEDRPSPETMVRRETIYKTQMQATKEQLEKSQIKDNVKNELKSRPSPSDLEEAGLVHHLLLLPTNLYFCCVPLFFFFF